MPRKDERIHLSLMAETEEMLENAIFPLEMPFSKTNVTLCGLRRSRSMISSDRPTCQECIRIRQEFDGGLIEALKESEGGESCGR